MKKKLLVLSVCSGVLFAVPVAAQRVPPKSVRDSKPNSSSPRYCNPCLFYGGDYNSVFWSNENDLQVPGGSAVYVPFAVPFGQNWDVTGLAINTFTQDSGILDPNLVTWSISTGLSQGNAGSLLGSGQAVPAPLLPTGRSTECSGGLCLEYSVAIKIPKLRLMPGQYWLSVVPQCTNPNDSACQIARFFLSDTAGVNRYGIGEPVDRSFFTSNLFGDYFVLVNKLNMCQTCTGFSAAVIGNSYTFGQ